MEREVIELLQRRSADVRPSPDAAAKAVRGARARRARTVVTSLAMVAALTAGSIVAVRALVPSGTTQPVQPGDGTLRITATRAVPSGVVDIGLNYRAIVTTSVDGHLRAYARDTLFAEFDARPAIAGRHGQVVTGTGSEAYASFGDTIARLDSFVLSTKPPTTRMAGFSPVSMALDRGTVLWVSARTDTGTDEDRGALHWILGGEIVASLPIEGPGRVVYANNLAWLLTRNGVLAVSEKGSATERLRVVARFPARTKNGPDDIAADGSSVWVIEDGDAYRIDAYSNKIDVRVPDVGASVAVGGGWVWIGNPASKTVARYDARTGEPAGVIAVDGAPLRLLWAGDRSGDALIAGVWGERANVTLVRIEPGH